MDTGLLKSFMAVARLRSFTLAGQELHLSQSTVTAHIQVLERMLGTRLVDRLSSGAVCTPAGERAAAAWPRRRRLHFPDHTRSPAWRHFG
jgi:DNA-binding transcriptional LysR family regulator